MSANWATCPAISGSYAGDVHSLAAWLVKTEDRRQDTVSRIEKTVKRSQETACYFLFSPCVMPFYMSFDRRAITKNPAMLTMQVMGGFSGYDLLIIRDQVTPCFDF